MESSEARILLAIEAIQTPPTISIRQSSKLFGVLRSTIQARMEGRSAFKDSRSGKLNLIKLEEEAIVQYILDLDSRGFSPKIADVGDMANLLLQKRGAKPIGKNWPGRFISRVSELNIDLSRRRFRSCCS